MCIRDSNDIKSRFGQLRAFGSVGWAFGVLIVGFVISNLGYKYVTFISVSYTHLYKVTSK